MGRKVVIGPFKKGLTKNEIPAFIDNDAFPMLRNAYQSRGRVKRKRGTTFLCRLTKTVPIHESGGSPYDFITSGASPWTINTIFSQVSPAIVPGTNGQVQPGSVVITINVITFTDQGDGTLTTGVAGNSGTIDYLTGIVVLTHTQAGGLPTSIYYNYYPNLPVMGLEDFDVSDAILPKTMGFDTTYSYLISGGDPFNSYDVSYFKNPISAAPYVAKGSPTPLIWSGEDYQQFYTNNDSGALWATNGITLPFNPNNFGMQFAPAADITYNSNTATTLSVTITNCPLQIGDFVFVNEWSASSLANADSLNYHSGYVTNTSGMAASLTVEITFPDATIAVDTFTPGIVQYLTNTSDNTRDCLRWFDGDPTDGASSNPVFSGRKGWVNFSPPISQLNFSIANLPAQQYYLVTCRIIFPFKDRLLFIGPVVQTSTGVPVYLPDVVIYSQNGTPFYTASFPGSNPIDPAIAYTPILVPDNQTATPSAYFSDQVGFGGFVSVGVSQKINTAELSEDVLVLGLDFQHVRMIYTGNDILPFNFYTINNELGASSTFSTIALDKGILTKGTRGFTVSNQVQTQRFDLQIPDEVFTQKGNVNANERFTAQRDFQNEWVVFSYPRDESPYRYPSATFFYNYRDASWAIFYENYTTYGLFRATSGFTWATIGKTYPTWADWNVPWGSGLSTIDEPDLIAGNQQGFVVIRDEGTGEAPSLYIKSISSSTITSPDHCLTVKDFIIIKDCLGSISQTANNKIFQVTSTTDDTFTINPTLSGTYEGNGVIIRLYKPDIQTKQFPVDWEMARKTRLGPQQYLLTHTDQSQISLLIFLSQNSSDAYNNSPIVPNPNSVNNSLVYSTVLYTCNESMNLGLTPANINLQMVTGSQQERIWHRMNTSLIGDTIQIGFTLSDDQMRMYVGEGPVFKITGISATSPCVLQCTGRFSIGSLIEVLDVEGMVEINQPYSSQYWTVTDSDDTTVTLDLDATGFTAYDKGGTAQVVISPNHSAEIELHGVILDVSPSMVLA
jgi:hypothetical protein